jgi:flagellar hook-associated protein 2
MATVTSLGSGSGLDLEGLITNLMNAERTPLIALQKKESSYNTTISALGSLKSKLSELQTAANALKPSVGQTALDKFASFSTTVADSTIASATSETGAVTGNYALTVSKLAQVQTSISTAPPAVLPAIGDTLSFSFASNGATRDKTITIDSTNNSLSGLRNAINSAQMGVTATIVNGKDGAQLILTGEEGVANGFTLTGTGNLATSFVEKQASRDAEFTINGIVATSSSNKVAGILDGVTLNLVKEGSTTFSVTQDNTTNLTTALTTFIQAFNDGNTLMKSQGAYNQATKVAGALQGNGTLRSAQETLRSLVFNSTSGGTSPYQRLSDIGITVSSDGTLKLDSTKLSNALAADASGVAKVVSSVGIAYSTGLEKFVGISGSIQTATDSANKLLKSYAAREASLERHLDAIETQYRKRFTALDTFIAGLKQTSSYLAQQLASLPGSSS